MPIQRVKRGQQRIFRSARTREAFAEIHGVSLAEVARNASQPQKPLPRTDGEMPNLTVVSDEARESAEVPAVAEPDGQS